MSAQTSSQYGDWAPRRSKALLVSHWPSLCDITLADIPLVNPSHMPRLDSLWDGTTWEEQHRTCTSLGPT